MKHHSRILVRWLIRLIPLVVVVLFLAVDSTAVQAGPEPDCALAGTCTEHLRNGGFETGTFMYWTTSGSPTVLSTGGHSGSHTAKLGGRNYAMDEITQIIPCP